MKPFDECEECGFWLGEDEGDCCEFSLTNDPCFILNIEIDKFYEEDLDEEEK